MSALPCPISPRLASPRQLGHELIPYSVVGLNLLDPGSAPKVIKTWDDRLEESGVESGVDDEVGAVGGRGSGVVLLRICALCLDRLLTGLASPYWRRICSVSSSSKLHLRSASSLRHFTLPFTLPPATSFCTTSFC